MERKTKWPACLVKRHINSFRPVLNDKIIKLDHTFSGPVYPENVQDGVLIMQRWPPGQESLFQDLCVLKIVHWKTISILGTKKIVMKLSLSLFDNS